MGELLVDFTHPLVDRVDGAHAYVDSRAERVVLTESMADALVSITSAGLKPLWVTGADATLSYLAWYHLTLAGGRWIVRDDASFRDPLRGVTAATIEQALGGDALAEARRPATDPVRLLVAVSTHAPADDDTRLGDAAISLSRHLAGIVPAVWGAHEPMTLAWNRTAYTTASRAWMPGPVRWMIADADGRARFTTTVRRTKGGVEEVTTGILLPRAVPPADIERFAVDALSRLATDAAAPLFATVSTQQGRADLGYDADPVAPAEPLAALIGPRATRALAPDFDMLEREFGARTAGKPRTPSLVVGFGSTAASASDVAVRFSQALGTEQITRLLARNGGAS